MLRHPDSHPLRATSPRRSFGRDDRRRHRPSWQRTGHAGSGRLSDLPGHRAHRLVLHTGGTTVAVARFRRADRAARRPSCNSGRRHDASLAQPGAPANLIPEVEPAQGRERAPCVRTAGVGRRRRIGTIHSGRHPCRTEKDRRRPAPRHWCRCLPLARWGRTSRSPRHPTSPAIPPIRSRPRRRVRIPKAVGSSTSGTAARSPPTGGRCFIPNR